MPDEDQFPTFPPGPRWFACLHVGERGIGVHLEEGTDETTIHDLCSELDGIGPDHFDVIYVFGKPVTQDEIVGAAGEMFLLGGKRMTETFADRLAGMWAVSKGRVVDA